MENITMQEADIWKRRRAPGKTPKKTPVNFQKTLSAHCIRAVCLMSSLFVTMGRKNGRVHFAICGIS